MRKRVIFLFLIAVGSFGADSNLVPGESLSDTAARTGYTVDELRRLFPPVDYSEDTHGFAGERFRPPPEPYVHPRVYFNLSELPERRRLHRETEQGRLVLEALKSKVRDELTGEKSKLRDAWRRLSQGDGSQLEQRTCGRIWPHLAKEAYRCLIEEDAASTRNAVNALVAMARFSISELAKVNPTDDWQYTTQVFVGRNAMALCYDYLYNDMDQEQQAVVRSALVAATAGKWSIGMGALPAWEANMMNWIPWVTGDLMVSVCAIEGETGCDNTIYPRIVQAYKQLLTLGFFKSGASYEAMGKNSPRLQHLVVMAKRGANFFVSEHVRNHVAKFRLHTMQPFGKAWIEGGNWGGPMKRGHFDDVYAAKWAFPNDPAIDLVYRNVLEGPNPYKGHVVHLFPSEPLSKSSIEAFGIKLLKGQPLSFFCEDRGLLVTRSSWDPLATQLYFEPRSIVGGHRHGNRNTFVLSALGRVWTDFTHQAGGSRLGDISESRYQNVTLIDGRGQEPMAPPARVIDFQDGDVATFAVGDARLAYSVRQCLEDEDALVLRPNDFRLRPSKLPWMNLPWKELPDWYSSQKLPVYGADRNQYFGCSHERKWEANWTLADRPVMRAFRTAGLVRGVHPYALIVEDLQQDQREHHYEFLMQLPRDLELESVKSYVSVPSDDEVKVVPLFKYRQAPDSPAQPVSYTDVILRESAETPGLARYGIPASGQRRLLVRVLECGGDVAKSGSPRLENYVRIARTESLGKRLVIPSRSITPNFKIMLYPFRRGQKLPESNWSLGRAELIVKIGEQVDRFEFRPDDTTGRTQVSAYRGERRFLHLQ